MNSPFNSEKTATFALVLKVKDISHLTMIAGLLFLGLYVLRNKRIPVVQTFVFAVAFAQYVGISLTASESVGRLLLPVFPLFLILIGMAGDYFLRHTRQEQA